VTQQQVFAAVDVGASGGRVIAGVIDGGSVSVHPVHRFPNVAVESDGHLRWQFGGIVTEVRRGLEMLIERYPQVVSIGIDTWAVDYGLLDDEGHLLADPIAYRDDRTLTAIDRVHAKVPPEELFQLNGLQFLPLNTIYQLVAEQDGDLWARAGRIVLLPDLLAAMLGGELRCERTNASTTGLIDVHTSEWSAALLQKLDIPRQMLPDLDQPGSPRGLASLSRPVPITAVGSHDTASAVVGVPATAPRFGYVSSGTWSLVGVELDAPVLTEEARAANFTNEGGADGRIRFLRNVGGLWLLQESMREWQRNDLDTLTVEAAALPAGGPVIDVDDVSFIAPGDMPTRIAAAAERAGGRIGNPAQLVRCVLDSLATAYARTIEQAATLSGRSVDVIHIVGGGSRSELLCQLTADLSGRPVIAGPVEATALGNILIQARTHDVAGATLEELRDLIASSSTLRRYEPT
jgi:rhamnulokinase